MLNLRTLSSLINLIQLGVLQYFHLFQNIFQILQILIPILRVIFTIRIAWKHHGIRQPKFNTTFIRNLLFLFLNELYFIFFVLFVAFVHEFLEYRRFFEKENLVFVFLEKQVLLDIAVRIVVVFI